MGWTIEVDANAEKQLGKLNKSDALRIRDFLRERLVGSDNPRRIGMALVGKQYKNLWRYRVGDYRIICRLQDQGWSFSSSKSATVAKSIDKLTA